MKKIPTLFKKQYDGKKFVGITDEVTPGMEWVLDGFGIATEKMDGSCCLIMDDMFYKRYDAKRGKTPPAGAIPCCDYDPDTGHWPHWVLVDENNPGDKWFIEAYRTYKKNHAYYIHNGTYEAIGPHFQGNPYNMVEDTLYCHGDIMISPPSGGWTFESIREWLRENETSEGIVFWRHGAPQCKIRRKDFGFKWPTNR